jgi:dTDP-4-dehydrorhamnose reductase
MLLRATDSLSDAVLHCAEIAEVEACMKEVEAKAQINSMDSEEQALRMV